MMQNPPHVHMKKPAYNMCSTTSHSVLLKPALQVKSVFIFAAHVVSKQLYGKYKCLKFCKVLFQFSLKNDVFFIYQLTILIPNKRKFSQVIVEAKQKEQKGGKDMKSKYLVGKETNVCMSVGGTRNVAKLWPLGFDYICLSIVPPLSCRVHYIYTHAVRRICSLALLLSYSELERVRSVCSLPELEILGNRVGTWLLICKCDPT